jgi:hypothetical protein
MPTAKPTIDIAGRTIALAQPLLSHTLARADSVIENACRQMCKSRRECYECQTDTFALTKHFLHRDILLEGKCTHCCKNRDTCYKTRGQIGDTNKQCVIIDIAFSVQKARICDHNTERNRH